LYVNRRTKHYKEAIDFLQFMTSMEGSQIFTNVSNWQPATVGVKPSGFAAQFTQITEGYGWMASYVGITIDAESFLRSRLPLLWNGPGGVEEFQRQTREEMPKRIRDDFRREINTSVHNVQREDAIALASFESAPEAERPRKLALTTMANEQKIYQLARVLTMSAKP
jgi:hypothetical protein